MKEYVFTELGYFSKQTCEKIKKDMDGKTFMNFAESMKDYRDNPIKHTVKSEKFNELEKVGAFED